MDWDNLRYFIAVARRGSIRGAAAELGVNHSTVLRRIDRFEKQLGVRMFERLPTGYLTTIDGEEMLRSAAGIEQQVATIDRRVAGRDKKMSGLLRVALPESLGQKLLMPDLALFSNSHPGIEIELISSAGIADLSKREADVAIRLSNDPSDHLIGRRLLRYTNAVYASKDYFQRHAEETGDKGHKWISWDGVVADPPWIRSRNYPKASIRNRGHNSMMQLEVTKAGMGLCVLPCFMGDTEPTLQRLPPGTLVPDRDIWLLTHEDLRNTARIRKFMDFMVGAILGKRDLLEGRCPQPATLQPFENSVNDLQNIKRTDSPSLSPTLS